MFSPLQLPHITLTDVFARLAAGLKAGGTGVTVVTPNRRLALMLKREFDNAQAASGLTVWDTADILPFSAFIERAYQDALYSARASELPVLLTSSQEQALWEEIIRRSDAGEALLAVPETARLACEAWQLAHAWQIIPQLRNFPLNEDGKAFQDWMQRYERSTGRGQQTDSARLCDLVAGLLQHADVRKPQCLICYGFDILTPQQAALLRKIQAAGCEVMQARPPSRNNNGGSPQRVVCADSCDEIRHAAVWARALLEQNQAAPARIGVVVPEFAKHRNAIMRIFGAVMEPDVRHALPGATRSVSPFNASLGMALTSYPLVSTAFLLLELAGREIEFERASRLLRSPFLAGGETEMTSRARLDAQLRKRAEPVITLERLLTLIEREQGGASCPILAQGLSALAEFRKASLFGAQAPSALAKAISEALKIIGFPGERGLDSTEYQTLKKWHEVVADFATLDRVVARTGYSEAISRLHRMAAETLFQPETPDVPIQILGLLEAAGMKFDHLWVMGLSDEAWPQHPRPNPFLPIELQRKAGMPQSCAAESLERARRFTDAWLTCADEVIFSHPQCSDDGDGRALAPSPLIAAIAERAEYELPLPTYASHRDLIHAARRIECVEDDRAPALSPASAISGGTAVIKNQAACPFRALALHRLGAESLKAPHTGLDAMERGILVHRVLAQAWSQLKTKSALDAISEGDLEAMLTHAAEDAIAHIRRDRPTTLSGRFAKIEQQRLVRLAREWLATEKMRGDFTVIATEDKRSIAIGGLALTAQLDRVDQLDDGRRIVIDYKTGILATGAMLGERPNEPQLPLYLITAEPSAAAVAIARVKTGDMQFVVLARDGDLLPGKKNIKVFSHSSWEDLVAAWRADLAHIAASFSSGDARVDPKKYSFTCRYCDVKPFCRVYERIKNTENEEESTEDVLMDEGGEA